MQLEERLANANRFIKEDKYIDAFREYCGLFYDYPKNVEIIKTAFFLFDRIIEGHYDFEPDTAEQYVFRGNARFYKGDLWESIEDYDKALSINPELDYAIKCKAFSFTHLGEFYKAIELLHQAIQIKPEGEYFDDIAENFSHLNNPNSANEYHEKAIKHDPENARLWYNYAVHLGEQGDIVEALKKFEEAIRIYPQYGDALHNRKHYRGLLGLK